MPKVRTMAVNTPQVATHQFTQAKNFITPMGNFLRRTSLDELPQLWSICKGEMSLIGPRPALFNQYDLMELRTKAKVEGLLPGVTGLAQVNGRDDLSLKEKVQFDQIYAEKLGPSVDLKILFKTFFSVLRSENIGH